MNKIILLLVCIYFGACTSKPVCSSTQLTVLYDATDKRSVEPDAKTIISLLHTSTEQDNEAWVNISSISDKEINQGIYLHLPNSIASEALNTNEDPHYREREILQFMNCLKDTIKRFNSVMKSLPSAQHSECFRGITRELETLSQSKANNKILFVYSDLLECSDICSVYNPETCSTLLSKPSKIEHILDELQLLPSTLQGCKIVFVFQSTNRTEDKMYNGMFGIYKKLLTKRGAKVYQYANNPTEISL